ncbi:MAG: hypothetical protein KBA71_11910 [Opitutaceae bacterium]|nr:hypothetical protein [Opitutaceae bacterium]
MPAEPQEHSPPPAPPSKVPSWILLGFVIGATFVFLLRRDYIRPVPPPVAHAETPVPALAALQAVEHKPDASLATIEAVWAVWGEHAIWEGETAQVALWDVDKGGFSEFFEVVRYGDHVYFRSLTRLTRPVIDRGLGIQCPLQFTAPAPVNPRR